MTDQQMNTGPGGSVDLDNIFTYHAPFESQIERYKEVRSFARDLAVLVERHCPPSTERTTALSKIREAVFWANAAIACNEEVPTTEEQREADQRLIAHMRDQIDRP